MIVPGNLFPGIGPLSRRDFRTQSGVLTRVRIQNALRLAFVLVLERRCLQKSRVNPIGIAFSEFHPRSGLAMLKEPQKCTPI